jgi:hypothetical protein
MYILKAKNAKPIHLTHMSRKNLKNYRMLRFIFKTGDLIIWIRFCSLKNVTVTTFVNVITCLANSRNRRTSRRENIMPLFPELESSVRIRQFLIHSRTPHHLWNPKFHQRALKNSLSGSFLSQLNLGHLPHHKSLIKIQNHMSLSRFLSRVKASVDFKIEAPAPFHSPLLLYFLFNTFLISHTNIQEGRATLMQYIHKYYPYLETIPSIRNQNMSLVVRTISTHSTWHNIGYIVSNGKDMSLWLVVGGGFSHLRWYHYVLRVCDIE